MAESEAGAARGETAMTMTLPVAPRVMAALVGIAVPFLVFGRAVTAVLLIAAVVCVFFLPQRDGCLRSLVRQARTPVGVMVGVTLALWLPGVVFSLDPLRSVLVWTRLSCHKFRDNAVRLQLHALAYNLANFMRTLALPKEVEH